MIAPSFREQDSPHRLMNPHQSNAEIFPLNKNYARSSSDTSSSSETSSESSSDESGMETDQSNLVSLPSTNTNSISNSYNAHFESVDSDMAMLHSMGSNTVVNENDSTIPPPAPRTISPPTSQLSSTSQTQTDSFKRTLTEVCHRIVYNSTSTLEIATREKEVSEIAEQLVKIMRSENPVHFKNFSEKLKKAFKDRGSNHLSNIDWFQLTFEDLIEKVVDHPTWRSLLNTLNCSYIVMEASMDDLSESEKNELKSRMKDVSEKFIDKRFRRYIENNGNWEGLKKYRDNVVNYNQRNNEPGLFVTALGVAAGVFGALAIFRRS